jgi:hypothetical protein
MTDTSEEDSINIVAADLSFAQANTSRTHEDKIRNRGGASNEESGP